MRCAVPRSVTGRRAAFAADVSDPRRQGVRVNAVTPAFTITERQPHI